MSQLLCTREEKTDFVLSWRLCLMLFAHLVCWSLMILHGPQVWSAEITRQVTVQPIITRDDGGKDPAPCRIEVDLIDQVFGAAGVKLRFLEPRFFDCTEARDGKKDVELILEDAFEAGVIRGRGQMINILFVNAINGRPAPRGLGQQGGWLVFIAQDREALKARDAFVVAHECGHNLGLGHAKDDPRVPEDLPNLMGDGPFEDRVGAGGLTDYQAGILFDSPLARKPIQCLDPDAARAAVVDESVDSFFSRLQPREMAAMTGEAVTGDTLDACRAIARERFQDAVLPFTPEEEEAITWFANRVSRMLAADYPLVASQPWQFIKVKNSLCGGFSFTRGESILFSRRTVDRIRSCRAEMDEKEALLTVGRLFAHEQLHVIQRFFPDRFEKLYCDQWGFIRGEVASHPWIDARQLINPDAPYTPWILPHQKPNGTLIYLWLRTLLKGDHPDPVMGKDFMGVALELEKQASGFSVVCDDQGLPAHRPIEDYPDHASRFSTDRGLDHPNEISAYMFEQIMRYDFLITAEDRPGDYDTEIKPALDPFRAWCLVHLK